MDQQTSGRTQRLFRYCQAVAQHVQKGMGNAGVAPTTKSLEAEGATCMDQEEARCRVSSHPCQQKTLSWIPYRRMLMEDTVIWDEKGDLDQTVEPSQLSAKTKNSRKTILS